MWYEGDEENRESLNTDCVGCESYIYTMSRLLATVRMDGRG